PNGRFWMGKPLPGWFAESTQLCRDGSCVSLSCDISLEFLLASAVNLAGPRMCRRERNRSGFGQYGSSGLFQRLRNDVQVADMIGQKQHQRRIHGIALVRAEIPVRVDQALVELVGNVEIALCGQLCHGDTSCW